MDWNEGIEEFCLDITIRGFSKITIKNYRSKLKNMADYFTGASKCCHQKKTKRGCDKFLSQPLLN
ncbi:MULTISPECIES: hypothetical protein [Enterococcus]|uniref:hypothetical protein n=1 Tax=Enterococcus TaxID=1350 RepID=UPI00189D9387|nr:hypothetical protein [Enterococcus dispar]